jgi:hypothetical protein
MEQSLRMLRRQCQYLGPQAGGFVQPAGLHGLLR